MLIPDDTFLTFAFMQTLNRCSNPLELWSVVSFRKELNIHSLLSIISFVLSVAGLHFIHAPDPIAN